MILLTGATGTVGTRLLPRLIESGREMRVLVRDPQDLGSARVDVQLTLGDLADSNSLRHACRGVETVIHLAATFRDQGREGAGGSIEEINGLATARLIRTAEQAGASRLLFFSSLGADGLSASRYLRSKAAAERDACSSSLATTIFAPSVIHSADSIWERLVAGLSIFPVTTLPTGAGRSRVQPVTAEDVSSAVLAELGREAPAGDDGPRRIELANDQTFTQFSYLAGLAMRRRRRSVRLPVSLVELKLASIAPFVDRERLPTSDELELLSCSILSESGSSGLRELGIEPVPVTPLVG